MPSVLIAGANRGLGLEFARQYAADGWIVHGTARTPSAATALAALGPSVQVHTLDISDTTSIAALARKLVGIPIDVLWLRVPKRGQDMRSAMGHLNGATPKPNQASSSGASATFGMVCEPTISG